jgi:hypothetical protein
MPAPIRRLLASPPASDSYPGRADIAAYSLLKVRQLGSNIVELVANEYETDAATPVHSLNEPARYSREPFILTFLDLRLIRHKGQLTNVDRLAA